MTVVSAVLQPAVSATSKSAISTDVSARKPTAAHEPRHQHHHDKEHSVAKRGLKIFRSEMMQLFAMKFRSFSEVTAGIDGYGESTSVSQTASEILGMARHAVDEKPGSRAATLMQIRLSMARAVSTTRETISEADDKRAVNATVHSIEQGLTELEAAGSNVSTASMTTVDTISKLRTSLRLRTQEGDFVSLQVRRVDAMSATDIAISDGEATFGYTEIQVSSTSRLLLKIKGELNEAELSAIQDVFAQAEKLADEFFSGDIEAALGVAASLSFDAEQIAAVGLKFRAFQASSISQTFVASRLPAIVAEAPAEPVQRPDTTAAASPDVSVSDPLQGAAQAPLEVADPDASVAGDAVPSPFQALIDFVTRLTDYLDRLATRLAPAPVAEIPDVLPKFEFTRPVKIDILKMTFAALAPANMAEAPADNLDKLTEVVSATIDRADTASD